MKPIVSRMLAAAALAVPLWAPLAAAAVPPGSILEPDKLVILSTTDVKGKTGPCGCHVPKGGLARRASFADSMKAAYGQILLVDAGGFFPDMGGSEPASFLMDAMHMIGTDAVGVGDRELRFGLAFLREEAKRSQLVLTSANLIDRKSGKPVLPSSVVKVVGTVKVGIFSLMSDKVELGPARDSLLVESPPVAARRTVQELRRKGATVIVLLSQLGKVESEDLVVAVEGIDAVIAGRNVPMLQKGRLIKSTVACYGGEQGHYLGRTIVSLDPARKAAGAECDVFMLGPEVGSKPSVDQIVKAFEDGLKLRKAEQEKSAARDTEKKLP